MSKKRNIRNTIVFNDYYSRLKQIALSVFEWVGLPDTCSPRFMEETLFHYGMAVFVNDPELSFLNLRVAPSDTLNVYNEPVRYRAYSTGYDREYAAKECVFIRNNYLCRSTEATLMLYAEKLAELDLAMTVNAKAQKTPILIRCDEKTRMSLLALYNQYEENSQVIFGAKSLMDKPLEVMRTDAPYVVDRLRDEKRAVWNEALEFLGINTNPSDKKKERLIVSEVSSNNEQIEIQAECMLLTRQEACQLINKKYGLNVSVRKRIAQVVQTDETEVEDYG